MSLVAGKTRITASMSGEDQKAVTGFPTAKQNPSLTFSASPNTTTYAYVYTEYGTLAAGANTTINLNSFTTDLGEAVTATKLAAFEAKAVPSNTSALGGILRVAQGATNPATLFLGGTTPYYQQNVNTNGCCVFMASGSHETLSNTVCNVLLSNEGTNTIAYSFMALVGA